MVVTTLSQGCDNLVISVWDITSSSKDIALNLTSTRGFRGRLTLTEDILVELTDKTRPIAGLLFLANKVVMVGTHHKASFSWP